MASTTLTSKTPIILPVPPLELGNMPFAGEGDPDETIKKAKKDREVGSAAQYINFPADIPNEARELLVQYEKAILSYRSWASLRWWNTTYASGSVPQDGSVESAAKRVGYCARVAEYDMKSTPWLSMSKSEIKNKTISTSTHSFHAVLVDAILEGFVSLPSSAYGALENVFKVLTTAIETRSKVSDNIQQYIISERYEYSATTKTIRSFIRTSMFAITQEMVEIQRKKSSSTTINVAISYNEYEAQFNMDDWAVAADAIEAWKKEKMEDYVKDDTIDVPF
ncbi:hypothetical protein DSL72_009369 [Monilinia vaccinii-corymbosi]|uniref:Uncharacterized protein n=1 Tax=Monilinia vaccinii-corymbosi TaxID=61207 RepID=A0A8A3PQX2_9HELO|nr:hypothetical protein DSL72_009369 [Monilinia vaccinii-corymbosi]